MRIIIRMIKILIITILIIIIINNNNNNNNHNTRGRIYFYTIHTYLYIYIYIYMYTLFETSLSPYICIYHARLLDKKHHPHDHLFAPAPKGIWILEHALGVLPASAHDLSATAPRRRAETSRLDAIEIMSHIDIHIYIYMDIYLYIYVYI